MILQVVIDITMSILGVIINITQGIMPQINITYQMAQMLSKILTITTQANNMIHFIVGDFVVALVPATILLLGVKYIAYPIITIIRSVFINGNN